MNVTIAISLLASVLRPGKVRRLSTRRSPAAAGFSHARPALWATDPATELGLVSGFPSHEWFEAAAGESTCL